jgi:uncharacterized membrane protein YkvA (DUF1232 family)
VEILAGAAIALLTAWILLVVVILSRRPSEGTVSEVLRILPDTLRLLRRIASDPTIPRGARVRLWLFLAYLLFPLDLIPDFLPLIGYADDVVITVIALRSIVRHAGAEALQRQWPGTPEGLAGVRRLAGLGV